MQAIRVHEFGPPEVMKLETVPDLASGSGQVLVGVQAVGVNPVETYVRSGVYARKPELPYTPGHDCAGLVEAVGEGVVGVAVGDRVYTSWTQTGAYAQQVVCNVEHVHALAASVSFAQGAAVGVPYATAWRGLFQRAHAQPGETVLVHGATGGVGIAAVQIARAAGLIVIGTGGTETGRAEVLRQGAHHVLDHHAPGYLDQVMDLTNGRGVEVILEMLSNVNLAKDLTIVAMAGRIVVIGCRGTIAINPRDAMTREAAVLGMSLFNAGPECLASIHVALVAGLASGTLRPVVGTVFPLAEAIRAHQQVMAAGAFGKIVLTPESARSVQ